MSKNKLIGIVASILIIVSAWLPWMKISFMGMSESISGFRGERGNPGIFFVAIGLLCVIFLFVGKKWSNIGAMGLALCTLGLAIKYFRDATSAEAKLLGGSAGLGTYVMIIGGLGVIIGAFMGMKKQPTTPTASAA